MYKIGDKVIYDEVNYGCICERDYVYKYLATVEAIAKKEDLNKAGLPVNHDIITIKYMDDGYNKEVIKYFSINDECIHPVIEDLYIAFIEEVVETDCRNCDGSFIKMTYHNVKVCRKEEDVPKGSIVYHTTVDPLVDSIWLAYKFNKDGVDWKIIKLGYNEEDREDVEDEAHDLFYQWLHENNYSRMECHFGEEWIN